MSSFYGNCGGADASSDDNNIGTVTVTEDEQYEIVSFELNGLISLDDFISSGKYNIIEPVSIFRNTAYEIFHFYGQHGIRLQDDHVSYLEWVTYRDVYVEYDPNSGTGQVTQEDRTYVRGYQNGAWSDWTDQFG